MTPRQVNLIGTDNRLYLIITHGPALIARKIRSIRHTMFLTDAKYFTRYPCLHAGYQRIIQIEYRSFRFRLLLKYILFGCLIRFHVFMSL